MADKKADKKKPGFFARLGKYFRDAKGEFKKIVWPSRKQVWNNVVVVLVMVVIFAIATWGLDLLFAFLRDLLLKQF
ncbi:MAG: preprotein translocase subunit SecE [Oscillospiraceae bacterium]|jgi:preprotein translocase subunit SecE|nr:preprotein translocase subunit SecE [Oscillospiraceae bacterium]MBQ5343454.1 preprotein translocase subunit SecE [Oscillospiraceae bacterium]MBR5064928.1 preprotein translocase subunit SecE [Oscillospiraceae bacterium]